MGVLLASEAGLFGLGAGPSLLGALPGGLGDMEHIATVTVGSGGAASMEFTSIPGTFKHLQIRSVLRQAATGGLTSVRVRLNGVSTASYTWHYLMGDGNSATSGALTGQTRTFVAYAASATEAASIFAASVVDILDYASTSKNTTLRGFFGGDKNGSGTAQLASGLFLSTDAVSSVTLTPFAGGNWAEHSTAALYGVRG